MQRTYKRIPGLVALASIFALGCNDDSTNTENADEIGTDGTTIGDGDGDPTAETGTSAETSATDTGTTDPTATDTATTDPTTDTATTDPTTDTATTDATTTSTTDEGTFCQPGFTQCVDAQSFETCLGDGSAFGDPEACDPNATCIAGACVTECEAIEANPSSVGCSFFAAKMDNYNPGDQDSLIAGNISSDKVVSAQLYFVPVNGNAEQPVGNAIMIQPQGTYTWTLTQQEVDSVTLLRAGGVYRLETSLPVVAYQHSPIGAVYTNDASMLLPEHALTGNYIISSWPATVGAYPSYITAVGVQDGSTVNIEVRQASAGGGGVPALAANANTDLMMNRYSMLNLVVAQQNGGDLSGSIITSDSPLHVMGATECANVPNGGTLYCDHVEEAMLPLEYWGEEYVAAHVPTRSGNEHYFWRVYGGDDGVTVNATPAQPGFPVNLAKGQFHQFQAAAQPNSSFVLTGNGPFMPVQYIEGTTGGGGTGDPSMIQSVPTEQYLSSYAFVTGTGYQVNYVQVIRPNGGAEVFVDGNMVGGYYTVGNYQVSDVSISQGAHFATSAQPFGITQVGYTDATSYGYPGGMKLEVINPQ